MRALEPLRRCAAIVILVLLSLGSGKSQTLSPAEHLVSSAPPWKPIVDLLDHFGASGSMEISGRCQAPEIPDIPPLRVPAGNDSSPVGAVTDMFAMDPRIGVAQDASGIVRINEAGIPRGLLNVRISRLSFSTDGMDAVYNPGGALQLILNTAEVRSYIAKHHMVQPNFNMAVSGGVILVPPIPDLPHISGIVEEVTVSQVLDKVLSVFPGIWLYEECPKQGKEEVFYLTFYQSDRNRAPDVLPRSILHQ